MGDKRTDSGQFYPGGKVIPRQPVRPGGGADPNAVHYTEDANKSEEQKEQARENIGAGTSNFSGDYNYLANVPQSFPPSAHAASHAAGGTDPVTVAQSQVSGLVAALAAKRDKTDLKLEEPKNVHWVWTSNDPNCPEGWLAEANKFGAPKPSVEEVAPGTFGWFVAPIGGRTQATILIGPEDATVLEFAFGPDSSTFDFYATATRASATDTTPVLVDEIARVSQLPSADELLTTEQRTEITKVKDKADEFGEWVCSDGVERTIYELKRSSGKYVYSTDANWKENLPPAPDSWYSQQYDNRMGDITMSFYPGEYQPQDPITATRKRVLRTGEAATPQELTAAVAPKADRTAFAPEYSATSAYAVGVYVWHEGNIYQCVTAIASPGEVWTAAHWDGPQKLDDFFSESNSLLTGTIASETSEKAEKSELPIPLVSKTGNFTAESYKRFVVASMPSAGLTLTMHTPTGTDADVFECRFDGTALTADASVTFTGATVTKMEGETDTGVVKAGKVALMSAFWNGATWDVNWKVEG